MSEIVPIVASLLDREFPRNERETLRRLVEPIKLGARVPRGTLVSMASSDGKVRFRVLEKDAPNKGFSFPLMLNRLATARRVTPSYLLWYLSHQEVRGYLATHASGAVILRIPKPILLDLPIPLPEATSKFRSVDEVVVGNANDEFAPILGDFYRDYQLNFSKERYRTCIILAGAICELVLYRLLLDSGVRPSVLRGDSSLGLKKLTDYVKLLKLDVTAGVPLNHVIEIQKKRNVAVHADPSVQSKHQFSSRDLKAFDHVVRYFGL